MHSHWEVPLARCVVVKQARGSFLARWETRYSELYGGKKAGLKPLHDALMTVITTFGDDIELAPKKGYVSLRRKRQFAMIQPTTATRIDLGLVLKDVSATERLESAASFNVLFTHRVRVNAIDDVDAQVVAWMMLAYDLAG